MRARGLNSAGDSDGGASTARAYGARLARKPLVLNSGPTRSGVWGQVNVIQSEVERVAESP